MFLTSMRLRAALAAAVLTLGSAASAAVLDVTRFDYGDHASAQAALAAFQAGADGSFGPDQRLRGVTTETFEGYRAWDGTSGARDPHTRVGRFTSLGGRGTGASAVGGGTALQVRGGEVRGRSDVVGGDGWLDSNDTRGMRWEVGGAGKFNALAFLLTDAADAGAVLSIKAGDTRFSQVIGAEGREADGSIRLVRILLPEAVDHFVVKLRNDRLNDGFGVDGATIAHVAPVPVPPAALLLVTGAAALLSLRRRAA